MGQQEDQKQGPAHNNTSKDEKLSRTVKEKTSSRKAGTKTHSKRRPRNQANTSNPTDKQSDFTRSVVELQAMGSGEHHPMQRWLDEGQNEEPFFGFQGSRPTYTAYQPMTEWGTGEGGDASMRAEPQSQPRNDYIDRRTTAAWEYGDTA